MTLVATFHVVKDWIEKFGNVTNVKDIQIWEADCIFFNPLSDMAIIHTKAYNDVAGSEGSVACVEIKLLPPAIGDTIFAFGYYKPIRILRLVKMELGILN